MSEYLSPHIVEQGQMLIQQALLLAPLIGAIGLSFKQRKAIRERDGNKCIDPDPSIKHGGRIEVHHEIPKEFAEKTLHMTPEQYNSPDNLGSNCKNHHRGHPNSKHPNMHKAEWDYQSGDKQAIQTAVDKMKDDAKKGVVYWNVKPEFDGIERETIRKNNAKMDAKAGGRKGWWPFATKEEVEAEQAEMEAHKKK